MAFDLKFQAVPVTEATVSALARRQALLIGMLEAENGATIAELTAATGWQPHTGRGAIAGALKKLLGLDVPSDKVERRGRV